ncbi:NAD(P)-dependent oxidoreductase [Verminephrobacter eiseniae]|uniref:dihydrouracil dehydrogenase (NAD(+)) n=1 Tax=Verminephrobacter eiseniae (strain EF01-2) TaxID=391735 RepID=A1WQF0_VEREI|nr:NAD(P)-dependent oxidoreductase [Verminephrobacter eiseniae]ABM59857.1 FAD-dependent pyridine nucleotide-disulphide oxidoreductase [Verminephrobacter eiseniae EF01-2]MCW5285371.1 NAD(P)-dependent oxidoreductase [Verminephrobacter eiseniae]MCW5303671.1 NAD(P)-dependent oxidoreductase [Verminephrobacter eiseniae]MCW8181320.1 NAD(P)-dependent oxidoreductase [Verminephrobacter eiseniae]MCW8189971.1 NAD(P)-dependent oxidoreductase [Verminephrobacter eiseniae]
MDTPTTRACGLHAARLTPADYAANFGAAHPPLTRPRALIEAERCYYCHDAPCTTACPTGIDVPSFIQRIAQDNDRGAARAILQANPLGGICARVCPTELLCEQACVRNTHEDKPVAIGGLQRYATDAFFAHPGAPLFQRAAATGRRVAVVGAGPAGLACAHGLALRGHAVVLFEARPKPGGLNEYGLASYKTTGDFAQQEVAWLLSVGGIEVRTGQQLGRDMALDDLLGDYDAVFLGLGLAGVNALGLEVAGANPGVHPGANPGANSAAAPMANPGAEPAGLRNAVDFIAELRQSADLSTLPVGRRVLVIGGGMTAIDAAVQARLLGAQEVSIVYRRGAEDMPASPVERAWAQTRGVTLRHWASPKELLCADGAVQGMRFAATALQAGRLVETGESFTLAADMVLKAIGQRYLAEPAGRRIALEAGRIATDALGRTSLARVWAGGDCRAGGPDLTVQAVQHGKQAALSIHEALLGQH